MGVLSRISSVFAGVALAVLVSMTIASVIARYVFAAPFHWAEEISGLLMIWIIMIGAVSAERDNQHLSIPVFTDLLPARPRAALALVTGGLSMVVLAYCGYLAYGLAMGSQYKLTGVLQISWFWIDLAVPFGAAGIVAFMLAKWIRDVRIVIRGDR
ncbi:TRAP transporter small permease [Roseospira visakhapatnamensis]|uniref:TRAP transporter small permease protein n=1 Tax=Roseospira visakhapatnamensis TaxID=390880 RepID=A0A7W6W9G2_9PROT|nr:TRAP transporter small permease [Roseospira visakhapatnamensis]MBB4265788.1 TRAP-type C4-dicarboxylate transport system permease small subunit [Roseospira visakhapatnamensis]